MSHTKATLYHTIEVLQRRLSTAVDKQLLLMNRLIEAEEQVAHLEHRADGATGKPCPTCNTPMVSCATRNERLCVGCGAVWPWTLKDGQLPLVGPSRQKHNRVDTK